MFRLPSAIQFRSPPLFDLGPPPLQPSAILIDEDKSFKSRLIKESIHSGAESLQPKDGTSDS